MPMPEPYVTSWSHQKMIECRELVFSDSTRIRRLEIVGTGIVGPDSVQNLRVWLDNVIAWMEEK